MTVKSDAKRSLVLVVITAACGSAVTRPAPPPTGTASPTESIVSEIELPSDGTDVAVTPDGARAFVTWRGGVFVIDTAAKRVLRTVTVDDTPDAIAMAPDGRAWVMDFRSRNVLAFDGASGKVARVPIGGPGRPRLKQSIAVSRDGARVYAADAANDDLLIIDAAGASLVTKRLPDLHPGGIAVSPDGVRVYVVGCHLTCVDGALLVLDAASGSVVQRIALATVPSALALAPDGRQAYVAHGREAMLSVVDLIAGTVVTIPVEAQPVDVTVAPNGLAYVASAGRPSVSLIDPRTRAVLGRMPLMRPPRAITISPDGTKAYVTHQGSSCSVLALD